LTIFTAQFIFNHVVDHFHVSELCESVSTKLKSQPSRRYSMGDRKIERSVQVKVSPEKAFQAITLPAHLERWFATKAVTDPRPGGTFTLEFDFTDPSHDHVQKGEYSEVVRGKVVRHSWANKLGPTAVEWLIQAKGGGTEIRLTHTGWGSGAEWDAQLDSHEKGWTGFLGNLKTVLEGGADIRAAAMGMKTR
jgi:uncharacterized protein YndB with AHSA1/START domain